MVETVHDLLSASNDYNDMIFTAKSGSSFFFPVGQFIAVWPQTWKWSKPRANPTQGISPWRALGKMSNVDEPIDKSRSIYASDWMLHVFDGLN